MLVKKYPALLLLKCQVNRVNGWIANHVFSSSNLRDTFVEISKWILLNSIDFVLQVFNFRKIIRYWALKVTVCIQQWKLKCQENMNFDASGGLLWVNWNNCNGAKRNEEQDWVLSWLKAPGFDLEEIYFNLMLAISL